MTWIQTYTGLKFDLENPAPDMVRIGDIAHALSRLCRFTGHTPVHYSVAQHSVLVSRQLPPEHAFAGLMHDAAEAYVGDVSGPLKRLMRKMVKDWESPYDAVEARVWRAIAERFGLPAELSQEVKEADLRMLMTEKKMLGKEPQSWEIDVVPYPMDIRACSAEFAMRHFMERFKELAGARS